MGRVPKLKPWLFIYCETTSSKNVSSPPLIDMYSKSLILLHRGLVLLIFCLNVFTSRSSSWVPFCLLEDLICCLKTIALLSSSLLNWTKYGFSSTNTNSVVPFSFETRGLNKKFTNSICFFVETLLQKSFLLSLQYKSRVMP